MVAQWVTERRLSGEWIRLTREAAGLTLRELSRRTGLSPAFLSDVERGNRLGPAGDSETAGKILEALR